LEAFILLLPAGKYKFNIVIEYKLVDAQNNIYFVKTYKEELSNIVGLYYGLGKFKFEEVLKTIATQLLADLNEVAPTLKIKK